MMHSHRFFRYVALFLSLLVISLSIVAGIGWSRITGSSMTKKTETVVFYPAGALDVTTRFDSFRLIKSQRLLQAYSEKKLVRQYLVALGRTPEGAKQFEGDGKTPEGSYVIDARNDKSAYYKNVNISYPNEKDSAFARSQGKSPGGQIKIHGLAPKFSYLGELHRKVDWTEGCVALTNEEMEEVFTRVKLGAPIVIVP